MHIITQAKQLRLVPVTLKQSDKLDKNKRSNEFKKYEIKLKTKLFIVIIF